MTEVLRVPRPHPIGNRILAALAWIFLLWFAQASFVGNPSRFDFSANFYVAAQMFRQGFRYQLYDLGLQRVFQMRYLGTEGVVFCYPSLVAALYSPTALLNLARAHLLWSVISIALFMFCAFVLQRALFPNQDWFATFGIFSAFTPVYFHLLQGQVDVILLASLLLGFWAMKVGRCRLAGWALAIGLIKFQFILPFMFILLLRRQWRVLSGFVAGAVVFCGALFTISGSSAFSAYLRLLTKLNRIPNAGVSPEMMANLRGLLFTLTGREPNLLLLMALSLALAIWTASKWSDSETGFSLALIASLLVSYHDYPHSLILLILPLAMSAKRISLAGWNSIEGAIFLSLASPILIVATLFLRRGSLMSIPVIALLWVMSRPLAAQPETKPLEQMSPA